MAKLRGKAKEEFLKRMARGRRKAAKKNPRRPKVKKAAAKKPRTPKKKNAKLTGKKKAEFLARMARGRKKAERKKPNAGLFSKRKTKKAIKSHGGDHRPFSRVMEQRARDTKGKRERRRRRNQEGMGEAERMFETFHQKRPGKIIDYEEYVRFPDRFAELGKLIELRFHLNDANPNFPLTRFGDCLVVCTPDGSNIYFIGGDQSVNLDALDIASDKDFVELGPCTYICYLTVKGFHEFEPTRYEHRFGEENRIKPTLAYDRLNRRLFLQSGDYRVRYAGIEN